MIMVKLLIMIILVLG